MSSLANQIQKYIKELLANSNDGYIELQRSRLAAQFLCVPSQINYVLRTRFGVKQGYVVESQQGGGGYLRIIKLPLIKEQLLHLINQSIDTNVSEHAALELLKRLHEEGLLTKREMILMKVLVQRETFGEKFDNKEEIRAKLIKAMLITLLRKEFQ
ncbi:MAG: hypothetical protein APF76_01825 [Desulfitibacter sp. BRH_c19]|nr:MAG: hypothetical protein APF76_01825 [Desulfitibacter sp. BRH_c19]